MKISPEELQQKMKERQEKELEKCCNDFKFYSCIILCIIFIFWFVSLIILIIIHFNNNDNDYDEKIFLDLFSSSSSS